MERTVIDWVEELRGLDPLEAAETILSGLGGTRQHDVRTLAYALTAWAMPSEGEGLGIARDQLGAQLPLFEVTSGLPCLYLVI
jgi:hypothetical protein